MKRSPLIPCRALVFFLATAIILSGRVAWAETFTGVFTGTDFAIQVSNPVSLTGTLEAVTLRAVGENGAVPNTFDSGKSGRGGTGITAIALHEIWPLNLSSLKTPTLDMDEDLQFDQTLDTHFLVYDANLLTIVAPTEDRVSNHLYDPWGGFGTYLKGTFTDSTAANTTWDFAYLVVPRGTTVNLDFEIGAAGFTSETVSGSFSVVPEPSMLVLLTLGVLGLLVCRKRFAR